tara:strand:+ start:512 stop:1192 length:681 start_codon:yes stop_codon:yes gene_type:complete
METIQLNDFMTNSVVSVDPLGVIIGLALTALMASAISYVYIKKARVLSNKEDFVKNFIPISMTTMFIIVIVKSSLALSLGLVGALSIVRFRTAIKEPEELGYLFLCIAIGLGNGASQYLITGIALIIILSTIFIFSSKKENVSQDMGFIYTDSGENITPIKKIVDILMENFSSIEIKRLDESKNSSELMASIDSVDFESVQVAKDLILSISPNAKISFVSAKGLIH